MYNRNIKNAELLKKNDKIQKTYFKCKIHNKELMSPKNPDISMKFLKCSHKDCNEVCRFCGEQKMYHNEIICKKLREEIAKNENVVKCQKCNQLNIIIGDRKYCPTCFNPDINDTGHCSSHMEITRHFIFCCFCDSRIDISRIKQNSLDNKK